MRSCAPPRGVEDPILPERPIPRPQRRIDTSCFDEGIWQVQGVYGKQHESARAAAGAAESATREEPAQALATP